MNSNPPAFELRAVAYDYDGIPAIRDLSLRVEAGESVALLGANGCGKSTLLRLLDALCFPSRGSIHFYGEALSENRFEDDAFAFQFRRRVGLVFQNPDAQVFNATVFDEVAFGPLQMRWTDAEIRERVKHALELMANHASARAAALSPLRRRKKARGAGVGHRTRSRRPAARRAHGNTRSAQPEPNDRPHPGMEGIREDGHHRDASAQNVEPSRERIVVMDRQGHRQRRHREILNDRELLLRANLVHAHRHSHGSVSHSHPHLHSHGEHEHEH